MDHRISKDMISSGMTPSGEKSQADLGRTQYGSAPSPNKLMDAYKSMYDKKEETQLEDSRLTSSNDMQSKMYADKNKSGKKMSDDEIKKQKGGKEFLDRIKAAKSKMKKEEVEQIDEGIIDDVKSAGKAVYSDVKSAIKNRYNKFKDHQKARSMGLKGGKISPDGVYSSRSKDGGFSNIDLRFDTDLFDLVKGDLINEGLTDSEASRMMLEMREEITFLYSIDEGLPLIAKAGLAVGGALLAKKGIGDMKKKFNKFLNKQRNQSPIGGNKRVDDTRAGSGDSSVGQKINY